MEKRDKINKAIITCTVAILIMCIPSFLIWSMNLDSALINTRFNRPVPTQWFPITASIFLGKCISMIVGILMIYKGVLDYFKK